MAEPINNSQDEQARQAHAQRLSKISEIARQLVGLIAPGEEISVIYDLDKIVVPGKPSNVMKITISCPVYVASMHFKK